MPKEAYSWVGPDLKPVLAQVALAPEVEDRGRVVHADLALFGIVAHSLTNVVFAVVTFGRRVSDGLNGGEREGSSPPNVVR